MLVNEQIRNRDNKIFEEVGKGKESWKIEILIIQRKFICKWKFSSIINLCYQKQVLNESTLKKIEEQIAGMAFASKPKDFKVYNFFIKRVMKIIFLFIKIRCKISCGLLNPWVWQKLSQGEKNFCGGGRGRGVVGVGRKYCRRLGQSFSFSREYSCSV